MNPWLDPPKPATGDNGVMATPLITRELRLRGSRIERTLRCRVLQSPLAGVSDRIFRSLVRRWSSDALLFSEMVNDTSLELGHGRAKVEELSEEPGPIGVPVVRPPTCGHGGRRASGGRRRRVSGGHQHGMPRAQIARKGEGGLIRDLTWPARSLTPWPLPLACPSL